MESPWQIRGCRVAMSEIQEVRGELEACERTIERGLNTFIEVGLDV